MFPDVNLHGLLRIESLFAYVALVNLEKEVMIVNINHQPYTMTLIFVIVTRKSTYCILRNVVPTLIINDVCLTM